MKTRIILLIAISAIITFSFTVVSVNSNQKTDKQVSSNNSSGEPIGGFTSDSDL